MLLGLFLGVAVIQYVFMRTTDHRCPGKITIRERKEFELIAAYSLACLWRSCCCCLPDKYSSQYDKEFPGMDTFLLAGKCFLQWLSSSSAKKLKD